MQIGIIGLPNVGKSTLFNAVTGAGVAAENFPFTTIEPNVGIVSLDDERLAFIHEKGGSKKMTPAGIRFVDIAGLVKGASQGEGLGNKFLSHIRSVDALAHVIRFFQDENVAHVLSDLNPVHASEIIATELMLADIQQCERILERFRKPAKSGEKEAKEKVTVLDEVLAHLNAGKPARLCDIPVEMQKEFQFLTAKPLLYVVNSDEGDCPQEMLDELKSKATEEHADIVVLCAKLEAEIIELPPQDRAEYYAQAGIDVPGLTKLAQAGQKLLNLVCFFTSNQNESRAWLIPKGTKAVKAAGKIHTDMERGFIRAEVYKYNDLARLQNIKSLHEQNLISSQGKDYCVQEGDVIYFRFHA